MNEAQEFDEIDRIVDRVIENPRKAAKLKEALHTKHLVNHFSVHSVRTRRSTYDDITEDLWDNVPV